MRNVFLLIVLIAIAGCQTPIQYNPTVDIHTNAYVLLRAPDGVVLTDNHTEAVANGSAIAEVDAVSSATTQSAGSGLHRGHPVTNNFFTNLFTFLGGLLAGSVVAP